MSRKPIDPRLKKDALIVNWAGHVLRVICDPIDGYVMARVKGCQMQAIYHTEVGEPGGKKPYKFTEAPKEPAQ